jgi:uncharacterized membrane protein YphA (DoxX/SURF4 family)
MSPQTQTVEREIDAARWSLTKQIAFRLCFIYFGLFCLVTQILGGLFPIPKVEISDAAALPPMRQIVFWTAAHVFHIDRALVYTGSGSGDKTFDWVLAFCLLVFSVAAAGVWSILDRRRTSYDALYRWFRLFVRFALASEMFLYGMDKAVPLQMPFPGLSQLVEPYGNFSPMGILWSFVGSSRPYEIFVGCAELLGGLLLIFPRTTMLGALVCLADLTQVFMLNMTYDVPVKLFSFHLLLMSLFLLAPDLPRLYRLFFLDRATGVSKQRSLFRSRRANRIALGAQVLYGILLLVGNAWGASLNWYVYGGARPKSPLYGIWNVNRISGDGGSQVPAFDQWHRMIFDFPIMAAVQRTDNSLVYYRAAIDTQAKTISITGNGRSGSKGQFTFDRAGGQLTLAGDMDGQRLRVQMQSVDAGKLPLVSRGFHWIQEYPYNR